MSQALIGQWRKEDAAGVTASTAGGGKDGSGVRAMFEASADLDAPKLARGLQLAQTLGLPESVVLEQPEWAERETIARAVEKHPLLARWAEQDRQNAAFARDDAEGLSGVFAAVDGLSPKAPDPVLNFEAREQKGLELTRAARAGDEEARADILRMQGVSEDEIRYGSLRRTPNPGPLEQLPLLLREGTDQVGKSVAGAVVMLAENLQSQAGDGAENATLRAVARHVRNSVEERELSLSAPLQGESVLGGYAQDVVRMVPQVLGQIGVTYATGGAGGMAFMGSQIAGGQYLDLTEKGVEPGRAAFAALVNAGLQAPLEQIGLGRVMDIFKTSGLGKVLLKTGEAVGTGMLTEYLQEYPEAATTIWAEAEKEGRTTEESVRYFLDQLGEIHRNGLYSAAVAAPFGLLGGVGRIATDAATAREAADFARRHKALHAKVEASQTRRLSPAHMVSALEAAGLTGTAHLPASDVLELHQSGLDILEPLGWQARDVADAAALGQDLEAPLSRLHARLDAKAFDAVADIMRPEPGTMTAAEAANLDERLQADVEDVNAAFAAYQAEQNAIDAEVELWRAEVAGAVTSVPNLAAAIKSKRLTPDAVAETYVAPLLNFAERLQEHTGLPVAETLRKLRVQGLVRDGKRLLTPDEMLKREEARARAEAEAPFWDAVWGRLDGQSLKRDYPDAYRELSRLYGPGLFAKKGGGLAIDELADEMEGAYLLEQGSGGDALMERLKQGKKPDRTLFQPVNEGVDLDAPVAVVEVAPRFAGQNPKVLRKRFPEDVRRAVLAEFESPEGVVNADTGWHVGMSAKDFHEHLKFSDADAVGGLAQLEAVAALPDLMRTAKLVESYEDRKNNPNLQKMHRFQAALRISDKDYSVKLTVKEFKDGTLHFADENPLKLYHHRLEKEMPAGNSDTLRSPGVNRPSAGIHEYSLRALLEDVKDSEGQAFFQTDRADARGSIKPTPEGHLIQLYQKADLSTLLHEMGHFFLLEVDDAVRAGLADDTLQTDYATLRRWLKAEDGAELTREQHEQFARGFEAYLMEGKAPSASLESAFARFKKWLTRIYKKARALNVDLTDEVRGVFDRLLATDAEVNARAVENGLVDLTARELDALGLKGPERASVSGLMRAACDAAEARMRADRDRQRREQVRQWAAEARAEVDADPLYGAMKDARAGGLDLEAVRQDMGEDYAARLMKRLPVALRKEGGADPAIFAAEHGFRDSAEMFTAMLDAPKKGDLIRKLVDDKQQAWDANFDPADYLLETAEAARQMELVGQYVARARGSQTADQRALKRVAAARLAAMSMGRATRPGTYRMNMRRALTAERRAIVRGEWQAALEANFQARINMEFARQSLDLKRSVETLQAQIRRFTGMSRADPDARFLVGALAQRHDLGKLDTRLLTEERQNPGDALAAWIKKAEADGCPVIMDNAFARPDLLWRDMDGEAFEQLAETIRQIVTVERNRRKLLTARDKADLDAVAEDIAASVAAFREAAPVKTVEKENAALKSLKGLHAIHAKVEALCLALDGDRQGPMWEYVYRPITKAEDEQSGRLRAARDELRKLFGVFSRQELFAMRRNREYIESVGEKLTRENMLLLALNMGNETNIARVREGHQWTDAQIGDVLSRLTRRDWEFVQSVWNYLETFRDESFKLQEDITGLRPQEVEAKPLTVTTADGHTLTLRGGYFPIKYNAEKGFMAYEREQRELNKEFFGGNSHSAPQTRQGHLKERARKGTGEPLLLELSVVTDHVFNVIHDLSYRRAVLDVAKVIRHSKVQEALTGAVGMDMVNQLKPWLMDVANERQEPMHAVHRWANWARASTSIMQMGWKVTTMLAQPLGITQTAEVLGYGYTATGLKKVYGNPLHLPELLEETFARSPMMADRIRSFDREIRDMTKKLMPSSGLFGWVDKVRDSAFVPIGVMQMGVDLPTWWGGYAKGLRDFQGDEARAAEYADSVVRLSQGGGATKDLARVQRGGPLPRLFTMFYSYFNTFYNLAARRFTALRKDHSPAAVFRAANTALLLWFVPAVLGELMAGRGPDDDDEWDEWAGMLIMQYPFQAVVGVRDVANHVFGEYGYQITPAQAAPKALGQWFKSVNKALEEEDAGRLVKPTVEAAGYLFGLPMKQPIITVGNIWDYLTGEDPEFEVRDLFFTKPKDRR